MTSAQFSRPWRVLQIIPAMEQGGSETSVLVNAQAIVAAGGEAWVASSGGRMVAMLEDLGGRHIVVPELGGRRGLGGVLAAVLREQAPDIAHVHSRAPAWGMVRALAGVARRPAWLTTWHSRVAARPFWKRLYNAGLLRADAVAANSRFTARALRAVYPQFRGRLEVMPRAVDFARFAPMRAQALTRAPAKRAAWGVAPDAWVVLVPGRLRRWKGQAVALRALARLRARKVAAVGVFVGAGSWAGRLARLARRLLPPDAYRFFASETDMPAAYAAADVVLTPSLTPEPFGMVAIEALASKRLVLAFDHGGAQETVPRMAEDGVMGGWRVALARGEEGLAQALARAHAMPEAQVEALRTKARAWGQARYDLPAFAARKVALYESLARSRLDLLAP